MTLSFEGRMTYAGGFDLDVAFETLEARTAICGPSGSGKTTILALIAGLLRPSAGRIVLDDRVLEDTAVGVRVAPQDRGVGLVYQDNLLFPHRSVERNLRYGLERRPLKSLSFDRVVEVLELRELLSRRPSTLSGGQARRVALGRALLRGPALLLLDEPLTGLDEPLRERILSFLDRVLEEWGIPTLLVTHDLGSVGKLAEQVIRVEAGRVVE